ncbi:hypothetical protein CSB37_02900 [bacterium DOLZORAL124_38_8]|nr:MAG: hypothetical protein CSB37_02900 [bacterium DOLZORAL124_38_8]
MQKKISELAIFNAPDLYDYDIDLYQSLSQLQTKLSTKEQKIIQDFLEQNDLQEVFEQYSVKRLKHAIAHQENLPEVLKNANFSTLTEVLLQKLEYNLEKMVELWQSFLSTQSETDLELMIEYLDSIPVNTPRNIRRKLILQAALNNKGGLMNEISDTLQARGVFGILQNENRNRKTYYLSDTIKDGDIAKTKILDHYEIISEKYGVNVRVLDTLGSAPGHSLQTGGQVLDLIGSRSELEMDYHDQKNCHGMSIFVNNASRAKHGGKKHSEGSKCLWARVRDPKTNIIHNICGVDDEVFLPLYDWIEEFFVIDGMPTHKKLNDLCKGTQFRSLKNFIYPQALITITDGGCPPGYVVRKIEKSTFFNRLDIADNEMILVNPDHYWNGKSICNHADGIIGIAKAIGVDLDTEVCAKFFHPFTHEKITEKTVVITESLGKHAGKNTATNGSSRSLDGHVMPEIGKSWENGDNDDRAWYVQELPIGTRIRFTKK